MDAYTRKDDRTLGSARLKALVNKLDDVVVVSKNHKQESQDELRDKLSL